MKRVLVLGTVLVVGGLSAVVSSEQQLSQAALDATVIEQVRDNLYVITGSSPLDRAAFSGGNTGVYIGEAGITLVDTKLPGWGQALMDRIRTVSDKPVTTIINTHTHGDHVGSNAFFPESVQIVVQENTEANMGRLGMFEGDTAHGMPDTTYQDSLTLGSGDDRIELYHFGAGHTNGDTFILYPGLRVLQMGDMFPWRDAPFLDRSNGGSGVSFPRDAAGVDRQRGRLRHRRPGPHPGDHAGVAAGVPALHRRPAGGRARGHRGGPERGRSRRVDRSDGAVRGLSDRADGGGHRGHLRGARPVAQSGSANAMYSEPDGGPMRPPPAAITTYCRPSTA